LLLNLLLEELATIPPKNEDKQNIRTGSGSLMTRVRISCMPEEMKQRTITPGGFKDRKLCLILLSL
jgi:hypothetical protein